MPSKSSSKSQPIMYFAYGSNMHLYQMAQRCPTSVLMGVGRLQGWRWQINERGVANIVRSRNDYVEGVVYDIDQGNKRQLDRSEGVSRGFYSPEYLDIQFKASREFRALKPFYVAEMLEKRATPGTLMNTGQGTAAASYPDFQSALEKSAPAAAAYEAVEYSKTDVGTTISALIYISKNYPKDGDIRTEYIARMDRAITDGLKLGISPHFLRQVDASVHREPLASLGRHSDCDRSIPSRDGAGTRAGDQDPMIGLEYARHKSSHKARMKHAREQHPHIVKVTRYRYVETNKHDRAKPRIRSNSNPL